MKSRLQRMESRNHTAAAIVTAAVLLLPNVVIGQEKEVDVVLFAEAGAVWSDNADRGFANDQSDNVLYSEAGIQASVNRRRLQGDLSAGAQFSHYLDDTFDDETSFTANGSLDWVFLEDRLVWSVSDNFGQVLTNTSEPNTPVNRGDINVFSTGPTLTLPVSDSVDIRAGATYSDRYYELRDSDNRSLEYFFGLSHQFSSQARLALELRDESTEYDVLDTIEFDRQEAVLRYSAQTSRTTLDVAVGANRIEIQNETQTEPSYRISISRRISPRTTVTAAFDREFSEGGDSIESLLDAEPLPGLPTEDIFLLGIPNESTSYSISSVSQFRRSQLSFSASIQDVESVLDTATAREEISAGVEFTRAFSQVVAGGVFIEYEERDFSGSLDDESLSVGLGLGRRLNERVQLEGGYQWITRDSSVGALNFDENRLSLSISYRTR